MSAGPMDEIAQLRQCEALLQLGRAAEALARLSVLAARDPENPQVHTLMALALLNLGEGQRAVDAARRATALDPLREWPHRLASLAYDRLGKHKLALAEAREAVRLAPHEWRCFAQLAAVAKARRATRAEAELSAARALELAPGESETHRVAGMVAAAAGHRGEARASFHRALSINPQDAATLNELGRLAVAGKGPKGSAKLADAANGFARAVRTDPTALESRHNLDVVIQAFFTNLSYLLFVETLVLSHWLWKDSATWARALPVVLLTAPAVMAARFLTDLAPSLRRHVLQVCRRAPLGLPVAMGVFSSIAVVASAVAPQSAREGLVWTAFAMALISRFSLALSLEQSIQTAKKGVRSPAMSTGSLWCIAVALILVTLLLLMAATSGGGGGLRVGLPTAIPAIAAVLVIRAIRRRRRG